MRAPAPSTTTAPVHRAAPGVLLVRLDSAQAFPRHAHDTWGIGRIRRGAQRSWSAAGRVEAGPGDLIMVNPGEVHDGLPMDERGRAWHMLYLDVARVRSVATELFRAPGAEPLWRPVARDDGLAAAFETWLRRLVAPTGTLAIEEAEVGLLAPLLLRHSGRAPTRGAAPSIARARQRLDDDPARDPGLADLAADAGLSRFQLLRAFARELGLTPHAYLVQRRLALARGLIEAGRPLACAAHEAGFADQSHMTRAFRRMLGYTPATFARGVRP